MLVRRLRSKAGIWAILGALALVAPWVSPPFARAANVTVDVGNFLKFAPSSVTVDQGDSVTWRWIRPGPEPRRLLRTGAARPVRVDAGPGQPGHGATGRAAPFSHVFPTVGTFKYLCRVHPSMQGVVEVRRADKPAGTAGGQPVSQLSPATCASKRNFPIRIRRPHGARITAASVTVNGKAVAVSARDGRFTAPVDLRGLPKGVYEVAITAHRRRARRYTASAGTRPATQSWRAAALPTL